MTVCKCKESTKKLKDRQWEVLQYRCNHSAFNGNRWTPSDYSCLRCKSCGAVWRTKASYVEDIKNRPYEPRTDK